ncbi:dihydroorotate dehydrogenase electron transfer subunit [Chloroflexota bacterium]
MKPVIASVISNEKVIRELERRKRPEARNILGTWLMWLRCPEIAQEAKPGQFVMVRCAEDCMLPRPLSIHNVNDKDKIALLFAVWEDGKGTQWLSRLKKSDNVITFGPPGNGFTLPDTPQEILLVAGGIGIAPMPFVANQAKKEKHSVKLFRGASGEDKPSGKPNPPQHLPEELLPRWLETKTIASSRDGKKNMVTDLILEYPQYVKEADQIFACGPTAMYRQMAEMPELKGKPVQVSLEARMGCGRGLCYACTIRTRQGLKQVCKDGPVFNLNDIIWDEMSLSV